MEETRLEIFKGGEWKKIMLKNSKDIRYNVVINRIADLDKRKISHTNTFSIPLTKQNIDALGLNVFNKNKLAIALNSKFPAKYYIKDKVFQEGFLVINNTEEDIKINFIDQALELTDKWGSMTFKELLSNSAIEKPADYQIAIDEMVDYNMPKDEILIPLSPIGSRGYNLALFPNSLNAIGDAFQLNNDGIRIDNAFNPYQSRPVFNARAILDLAIESFGYTPIYDESIDWSIIKDTFVISEGLDKNQEDDAFTTNSVLINSGTGITYSSYYVVETLVTYPEEQSKASKPTQIPNWIDPPILHTTTSPSHWNYRNMYCIYKPSNSDIESAGTLKWSGNINRPVGSTLPPDIKVYSIWDNATLGGDVIFREESLVSSNIQATSFKVEIDKVGLLVIPSGTDGFRGIILGIRGNNDPVDFSTKFTLSNVVLAEGLLPAGTIAYDDWGQYIPDDVDLTHAAPEIIIKDLVSNIMQKEGMLISIDGKNKTVKLFSYSQYLTQRDNGLFYNWSNYIRKYSSPIYNTNYGNKYAKRNDIGLSEPFPGNIASIYMSNQGVSNKHKDYATNYVTLFKDVSQVENIINSTTPYTEFTNLGLGMIESLGSLGVLSQRRANDQVQGNFTGLAYIVNASYIGAPTGIQAWYKIVDEAIKIESKFLIPETVIRDLDISKPVYIEHLGGFYIIEEVAEYINEQDTVQIKLIKLIDNLEIESEFMMSGGYTHDSLWALPEMTTRDA